VEPYQDVGVCLFYPLTPTILFSFIPEYVQLPLPLICLRCRSRRPHDTGHHRVPNPHDLNSQRLHTLAHCRPLSMHSPIAGSVLPRP
jgi:hypothetical protein